MRQLPDILERRREPRRRVARPVWVRSARRPFGPPLTTGWLLCISASGAAVLVPKDCALGEGERLVLTQMLAEDDGARAAGALATLVSRHARTRNSRPHEPRDAAAGWSAVLTARGCDWLRLHRRPGGRLVRPGPRIALPLVARVSRVDAFEGATHRVALRVEAGGLVAPQAPPAACEISSVTGGIDIS